MSRSVDFNFMSALRILHLEDSPVDAGLVLRILQKGNLNATVLRVESESDYRQQIQEFDPNVILADYHLPSFDGLSALAINQQSCPGVPFIFVSGTIGEEIAVETLKNGAADYVLKDRLARLVPAINRALAEQIVQQQRRLAEEKIRIQLSDLGCWPSS